jgi:nicotinamidase-related amidase
MWLGTGLSGRAGWCASLGGVLMTAPDCVLLLIDLQAKLVPALADAEVVVARAVRLAEAARLMGVPVRATEQYPAGLGPTVTELAAYPSGTLAKRAFSAARDPGFPGLLPDGARQVVIAGCEAHVCVQQTVADLLAAGREVFLAADAVGSRFADDKHVALERARQHGAQVVTSEMVLFEWLGDSRHPLFRDVQQLLK